MPLSTGNAWGGRRSVDCSGLRTGPILSLTLKSKPANRAMTDHTTDPSTAFRPSLDTDELRPALLLAGTQIIVALVGAVLLTNGLLA